jgi:hypothetical protein
MDMGPIHMSMVPDMKDNGKMTSSMGMEWRSGLMDLITKESMF